MSLSTTQYGYIVDPMVPFTDDKGKTIKNGFIRVFMAGTSTPVLTYRNYDGATNQEKIELDNSGRVKHNVIGSKGSLYKVVVYDANHSQETPILSVDKIAVLGASVTGTTVVTGLDNVEGESDGFVKAEMVGTTAIVKLDATNVSNELTGDAAVSYASTAGYMVPVLSNDSEEPGDPQKLPLEWLWDNRSKQVVLEPSDFIGTGLSNDEWTAAVAAVGSGKTVVVKWTESDALRFAFSSRYEVGVSLVFVCEFGGYVTEYIVSAASNAHAVTTNVYELAGSHSITKFDVMWDIEEDDYVFPVPQDVIQAVSEYIDVQLVFNAPSGFKFVYSLTYKSGTSYEWTREDCRVKFNLTRVSDSPLIWAWSAGNTSLKQDIALLETNLASISEVIPSGASSSNKLATDNDVANSIGRVIAVDYENLTFPITKGTKCFHDGGYFYANIDIATSEGWTEAHWTETNVAEQIDDVKEDLPKLSILDYADDWKNITSDFSLVDGSLVYINNNVQGTLSDLNIKFSKNLKLIYFDCPKAWLISTTTLDYNWRRFLIYNGNDFETALNGGTNPSPSTFVLPYDVNRGMIFANCVSKNNTTRDFGMLGYVGSTSNDSGIAVKKISSYESPTGVVINKCVFEVIPK